MVRNRRSRMVVEVCHWRPNPVGDEEKRVVTITNLKNDGERVNSHCSAHDKPWRSMTAEDALAFLVAEDVARRTIEGRDEACGLRLDALTNRKRLVAWRRERGLCAKCGRAIPADETFQHCPSCRRSFRDRERRRTLKLSDEQRLARNERGRKSYHKIVHGAPPPPKVVTPDPMVTPVVTPTSTSTQKPPAVGPKRDRALYMRGYRANRAKS